MKRDIQHIINSQNKMLTRLGKPTKYLSPIKIRTLYENHLEKTYRWMSEQPNIDFLEVEFDEIFLKPKQNAEKICRFLSILSNKLEMIKVVDSGLKHF